MVRDGETGLEDEDDREHKDVTVARIAMWQAVVVAAITAFGGLALGYLNRPEPPISETVEREPVRQHVLTIDGVTDTTGGARAVRIVASVNGQAYSYPSRVVWAEVGPGMSSESFPLPIGTTAYDVSFEVFVRAPRGDGVLQLGSQDVDTIAVEDLATSVERTYEVFQVDSGMSRAPTIDMILSYSVR